MVIAIRWERGGLCHEVKRGGRRRTGKEKKRE